MLSNISNCRWLLLALSLIVLLGIELRLKSVSYTIVDTPVRADARDYLLYAINLKTYGIYSRSDEAILGKAPTPKPDAVRSPGYPLFLSLFVGNTISNQTIYNILIAQVILSVATILLTYGLFVTCLPKPLALLAAFFTAISPHLVTANVFLLSETLFCFLLVGFLGLLTRLTPTPRPLFLLGLGGLLALTALTRPWIQYFVIFLIFLFVYHFPLKRPYWSSAWFIIGFIAIFSGWTIRNWFTLGILSDNTLVINMLHHGFYPDMMYNNRPETLGYGYYYDPRAAEISASVPAVLREIFRSFIEQPLTYLRWYLVGKPLMVFNWDIYEGMGDVFIYPVVQTPYNTFWHFRYTHALMHFLHYFLMIFAVLGSILAWLPNNILQLSDQVKFIMRAIALLFFYFIWVHMVGAPYARYSIPMQPIAYGLALFAVLHMGQRAKKLFVKTQPSEENLKTKEII